MDSEEESLCCKEWDIIQLNMSQDSTQCVTIGHCTDLNHFQEIALLRSSLMPCSALLSVQATIMCRHASSQSSKYSVPILWIINRKRYHIYISVVNDYMEEKQDGRDRNRLHCIGGLTAERRCMEKVLE